MGGYRGVGDDQGIGGPYGNNPNAVAAAMQHHAYYNPAAAMGGYGGKGSSRLAYVFIFFILFERT